MTRTHKEKLKLWQDRYAASAAAYSSELSKMERRERLWRGEYEIPKSRRGKRSATPHLRNIISELIESQIDSGVPMPKVAALRECDKEKAALIEAMLRCEIDRLPTEEVNDLVSRTVLLQGGGYYLVEWDSDTHDRLRSGDISLSALHPSQVIPQAGIYSDIEDMDYVFLRLYESCESIEARFGVRVECGDNNPHSDDTPEGLVERIAVYYKSESGIGLYSYVGDTVLLDLPDYQSRSLLRCESCGRACEGEVCHECGGRAVRGGKSYEELSHSVSRGGGELSRGELLPYYKPRRYPVILQKNVSSWGQLLGESDCDRIRDQQYTTNALEAKIIDKLFGGGSFVTLPDDASIEVTGEDMRVIRIGSPASKALIDVYNLSADISGDMKYLEQVYEEARQIIGITDAYQGREDDTAQSGTAKRFSAEQAAGRFKSKRVMKNAAFARIYELIFRLKLAYCDDAFPVRVECEGGGETRYFSRYDFLDKDSMGNWYYNDAFVFSCVSDEALPLDRASIWDEIGRTCPEHPVPTEPTDDEAAGEQG